MIRTGILLVVLSAALGRAPSADTIHLIDDAPIADVSIDEETVSAVTYKDGNRLESVPSERVVRVEFERLPSELDEGETAVKEGDLEGGFELFLEYLAAIEDGRRERRKWAPPYAAKRMLDVQRSMGNLSGVLEAADRVLRKYSESRYVPEAYLAKADAQAAMGDPAKANATLESFRELIDTRGLPARWELECDLALVLTDNSSAGAARRDALERIISSAGDANPGVRNRARLALAEGLVMAATAGGADAAKLAEAGTIFETIASDPFAATEVLAGAFTGLGDCLFWKKGDDQKRLYDAGLSYMRVAVLYKEHSHYVAKSMFYAGRCFDLLDKEEHKVKARRLYRTVIIEFPESEWAKEARNFL